MSNKTSIPAWQRDSPSTPPEPVTEDAPAAEPIQTTQETSIPSTENLGNAEASQGDVESEDLLDQAKRFLDDPAIRDAPREKKLAFLESKGVSSEDIESLLGPKIVEGDGVIIEEAGGQAWSTVPPVSTTTSGSSTSAPARDIPPIITYPEFLAHTEKPPPLVTTQNLLTTAYATGGVMATIYGLSQYLIAPMTQALADARHEFASHTQEHVQDLNKRLTGAVSVDPTSTKGSKGAKIADDVSEADSDPAELFHRDFATQTTPTLSRRPSSSTSSESAVANHENRLRSIKSGLDELQSIQTGDDSATKSFKSEVSNLYTYLNSLQYENSFSSTLSSSYYSSSFGLPTGKDGKNSQYDTLKNDIRAVKGVLLSARNFPAGGRSASPVPAGMNGV